jgi:pimeloyl-ACP methyl ester carboxylesterase
MYLCHGFCRAEDVKMAKIITVFATPIRSDIKNSHLQIIPDTAHAIHDEKAPELAAILNGYLV